MKKYLALAVLALLLGISPLAQAQISEAQQEEARTALEATINQVLAELQKPDLHEPANRRAVLEKVEDIIATLFSFDELSERTVGQGWDEFTDDQKQRFIEAFRDLLRARYTNAFTGYNGGTVSFVKEAPLGQNTNLLQIDTTVNLPDKSVPVNYRMILADRWYVYDVVIEGVSMVQNYRSQFQSVLRRYGAEELIKTVEQKAIETQAK